MTRVLFFAIFLLGLLFFPDGSLLHAADSEQANREKAVKHFNAGQAALRSGEPQKAAGEFRKVLELFPDLAEARTNLGLALFLSGAYREAAGQLQAAAGKNPDLPAAQLFLGLSHLKLGRYEEAIPRLEKAVQSEPQNLRVRRALASAYLAGERYGQAAAQFEAIYTHTEDAVEASYQLGQDYFELSKELSNQLAGEHRETAWGRRFAGDLLTLSGRAEQAVAEYTMALEAGPSQPGLFAGLGRAHLAQGGLDLAEPAFRREIERPANLDPDHGRAFLGLAGVALAQGRQPEALSLVEDAWRRTPAALVDRGGREWFSLALEWAAGPASTASSGDETPARFVRAALYEAAGRGSEAAPLWRTLREDLGRITIEQLCRARGEDACAGLPASGKQAQGESAVLMGKALLCIGKRPQAAALFARALEARPDAPEPVYWLARTYQQLSQEQSARVEELAPDSWRAHQLRAEAHRLRNEDKQAIAEYKKAIELQPQAAELYEALGLIHYLNNSYEEAAAAFAQALELDASRSRTLYLMGSLFAGKQAPQEAVPYLERAVKLEPTHLEAHKALGKTYLRLGRVEEAVAELEKSVEADENGDVFYSLYQAYRRLGRNERAQKAMAQFQRIRNQPDEGPDLDRWLE